MARSRKRDTAGRDDRHVATGDPQGCAYIDVRRACHRWLMKNDPQYRALREGYDNMVARRNSDAHFAGF
jgi:hypothetical protein